MTMLIERDIIRLQLLTPPVLKRIRIAILTFIALQGAATASSISDGKGFFPVVVQVIDADAGTPVAGAEVKVVSSTPFRETELDADPRTKALKESLGLPVETNGLGAAVAFYYGRWSETVVNEVVTYSRSMDAVVTVNYGGKEIFRSNLKDWAKKNHHETSSSSAPVISVSVSSTDH
ncbi:hypothetical protein HZ994_06115 [Akkermansiaceae bacterium]|nr:hypothetical protein HZ994_06115 [Akkermansiaceae bacterium]